MNKHPSTKYLLTDSSLFLNYWLTSLFIRSYTCMQVDCHTLLPMKVHLICFICLFFFQNNLVCLYCLLRWEFDSVHDFSSSSWRWWDCRPNDWFVSNSTGHWRYQALRVSIWRRPVHFWSVSLASKFFLSVLFRNKCWKFVVNVDHTSSQRWAHQTSCY